MKIYCNRRQYENELDRYIGQDIWIYTSLMSNPRSGRYIRIVDKTKKLYTLNCVTKKNVEKMIALHDMVNFHNALKCQFKFTIEEVTASIIQPMEILTTEELFEGILE